MKICVLDIGTNSIHVVFARLDARGGFEVIGSDKEMVELGEKMQQTGALSEAAMARALECLRRYRYLAHRKGVDEMIVVATSAVREAKNGRDFVAQIRRELKLKVRVIDGQEEARLIALAVQNTVALADGKALIVDIGGGSTEIILANQTQIFGLDSLPLGSNRLKQMFPLSEPPKKKEWEALEEHVAQVLKPVVKKWSGEKITKIVGTSGTLGAVAKILQAEQNPEAASVTAGQVTLTGLAIVALYERLTKLTTDERRKIKGLSKKRAPMIVQGLSILKVLIQKTNVSKMVPCDKALREGLLFDYLQKNKAGFAQVADSLDLRRRSVYVLLEKYGANLVHAEQTARLALIFFDALAEAHKLSARQRDILEYAALLHDIGYHVSFAKHHRHSFYLILNSDLDGFAADEVLRMAWVARLHRRDANRKNPDFLKLPETQQSEILKLAACLQLADALDCSHFGAVTQIRVKIKGESCQVQVQAQDDARWEILEAQKRSELFEKVFATKIEFVQTPFPN